MNISNESGSTCAAETTTPSAPQVPVQAQSLLGSTPDIDRLKSALISIPPSNDLKVIAYHYIAPMAKAAIEFPEVQERMKELASTWACGELHEGKSPGLSSISREALTGKALFEKIWDLFIHDTAYKGPRRSLGSIYHVAKEAGWSYF